MFCKSTRYKYVFKHFRRGILVIVLGMRVVLGWLLEWIYCARHIFDESVNLVLADRN